MLYEPIVRFVVVALLWSVIPFAAAAQEEESTEPDPEQAERVIVTPTRTVIPYRDRTSSATVLFESELEATGNPFAPDALIGVPGLDIRRDGPFGQRTSFFLRGTDSDHTKVIIDGIEISDPSAPGSVPLLDHLMTPGAGRVEVIRGPHSTLYGSDAIGGVVQVITRTPRSDEVRYFYEAEGGSFSTSRQRFTFEKAGKHVGAFVALSYLDSDGLSASSAGTEKDAYRNRALTMRFLIDPNDVADIDLVLHSIDAHSEFDLSGADDPLNETDSQQLFFKAQPTLYLMEGRWVSKLNVNFAQQQRETFSRFFIGDLYGDKDFESEAFEVDWQNDVAVGDRQTVTFGIEGRWEESDTSGDATLFSAPFKVEDDRKIESYYVQDQIRLWGGRLQIVPGVRFDRYSDFGAQTTWRVATSYHHKETGTTGRASYGTAYNAPSLVDLFDPAFGNPQLEAEESRGFDVGVEQEFTLLDGPGTIGVTYFQNDVDELIQFNFATARTENIGEIRTRGVELFGRWQPCRSVTIRPSYTYTDTENRLTGARLARRPLHKGGVDVIAKFFNDRATAALGVYYIGERDDVDPVTFATVENEDYWLVRLAGSFQVCDNVRIIGRVENLLDEDYEDVLGFTSPGISAFGGVRITLP